MHQQCRSVPILQTMGHPSTTVTRPTRTETILGYEANQFEGSFFAVLGLAERFDEEILNLATFRSKDYLLL